MKRTISAVLCAALALTLAGCSEEKEPMLDQTVTVETTAAQTGELSTESTYIGTISAEGTASVVSLVIVAHGSPDGDAIGATGAMGSLVKALGKRFVLYNATGIPDYLEWVPLPGKLVTKPSAIPFKPGLIIVLDCGDAWRMGKELLAVFPEYPSVNIDHHLGNPMFASLGNWVDPGMAATGQMVAAVADAAGVPLTGELAQCVYLSLVSDTGSFTHGNTSAAVFTLAARLVANGLDAAAMREKLDNQWSMPKTKLWGKLMQTLSLECDGTVAVCPVTMEEIGSFGAVREDLEGFAEQMRRIKGVRVAVLIRQDPGNRCKLSLRSSGSDDVRSVAALFGGGGHLNAAGATIDDADMDAVTRQTIKAIQDITFGAGKEEKR